MNYSRAILKIQNSYLEFVKYCFAVIFQTDLRGIDGYAGLLIQELQDVYDGKTKKLMINMPPRFGKTKLAYICFVAWCLGRNPKSNFICVSMTYELGKKILGEAFDLINNPFFQEIFNTCIIDKKHSAKSNFKTTEGGAVRAMGSRGTITGTGAGWSGKGFGGCIIIDDLIKPDAVHGVELQNKNDWYYETLFSRRNSMDTPIIIIGQRLHQDDIFGFLLSVEGEKEWKRLVLKAVVNNQSLCEEVMSIKELTILKKSNPSVFAFQYQQEAMFQGVDAVYKRESFITTNKVEPILSFVMTDFAISEKSTADHTVFALFSIFEDDTGFHLAIRDTFIEKISSSIVVDKFIEFLMKIWDREELKPLGIYIESVGSMMIYQDFIIRKINELCPHINCFKGLSRQKSKVERFLSVSQILLKNKLYIEKSKNSYKILDELTGLTINYNKNKKPIITSKHDDICDVVCDALMLTFTKGGYMEIAHQLKKEKINIDKINFLDI